MNEEKKKNADYNGEDNQLECQKKFSNSHMMRNGYQYSDRYLVIKASHYMQKRKL
ncbi:hypothetical protein [uncultured Catenibacterium sp.]|uniref:hypothetical protein n=1 Tax=uncultured Catenibacterium sp. TaxID=286142 RepID=UPI0025E40CDE|nr:hypothetical protein [uncultured Catenibacterium sp.]